MIVRPNGGVRIHILKHAFNIITLWFNHTKILIK